jgi:hypothetical protein
MSSRRRGRRDPRGGRKFASGVLSPLNSIGDRTGAKWKDGAVTTPPDSARRITST